MCRALKLVKKLNCRSPFEILGIFLELYSRYSFTIAVLLLRFIWDDYLLIPSDILELPFSFWDSWMKTGFSISSVISLYNCRSPFEILARYLRYHQLTVTNILPFSFWDSGRVIKAEPPKPAYCNCRSPFEILYKVCHYIHLIVEKLPFSFWDSCLPQQRIV